MKVHSVMMYNDTPQNFKGKTLNFAFNKKETIF